MPNERHTSLLFLSILPFHYHLQVDSGAGADNVRPCKLEEWTGIVSDCHDKWFRTAVRGSVGENNLQSYFSISLIRTLGAGGGHQLIVKYNAGSGTPRPSLCPVTCHFVSHCTAFNTRNKWKARRSGLKCLQDTTLVCTWRDVDPTKSILCTFQVNFLGGRLLLTARLTVGGRKGLTGRWSRQQKSGN